MKKVKEQKRFGFTLIELVLILIIMGVLASVLIPRLERDPFRVALHQVVQHIRFTQHLSMSDDVYDSRKNNWYRAIWRISFRSKNCYLVSSNTDLDKNYDRKESARDPLSKNLLYSNTKCEYESGDARTMYLSDMYNIDIIVFSGSCGDNRFIAFDYLGTPLKTLTRPNDKIINQCEITFTSGLQKGIITIEPETGFVSYKTIE